MPAPMLQLLSENDIDTLSAILSGFPHEKAMSLEEVDGFFAAFHCSPELVPLSEYLPDIWGDETGEEEAPFGSNAEVAQFINLLMRYWNDVGRRFDEDVFFPNLMVDEKTGEAKGNEWAKGFLRGVAIAGCFEELIKDEDEGHSFVPLFVLTHEHDENPERRPFKEAMTVKQREELLLFLCVGVTRIYHYFAPHRKSFAKRGHGKNTIRNAAKGPGRNDPCYCGSGIKYKKCCLLKPAIH